MYRKFFKRFLDIILSGCALIVLSPLFLALIVAIKIDSRGPVLFRQKRVGIHRTYFSILKFRTMRIDTPHDVPTHMLENPEQWITRVGKFLRKTSLDELPQIAQIFTGKMSIIGPRPALWNQYDLLEERDKYGANDVKPGLTGWAQINGRDELEIPVKAKLDGEYVEKSGLVMDVKCFLYTIRAVFTHEGVVEGSRVSTNNDITQPDCKKCKANPSMKVSIIMPAYNSSMYISESIESVLKQSYGDWELIIVDDKSTDNTYEIISKYAFEDNRIIVIQNDINSGVAISRNNGLKQVRGKFVAFLDSDDLWMKDKLIKQVEFMQKKECVLSFTEYQKFDSKTGNKGRIIRVPSQMTANDILGNTIIGCLTVMINRELSGEISMPLIKHMEDNATWRSVLETGHKAFGIHDNLALYRENKDSLTGNRKKSAKLQWNVYREYYKFTFLKSAYYFTRYAFNAARKHF